MLLNTERELWMLFTKFSTHFVFLHYVWGSRQGIPVYKRRSRAIRAIGAFNQPKNLVEETNICIDGRQRSNNYVISFRDTGFSSICLDHQLAFHYQWCLPDTKHLELRQNLSFSHPIAALVWRITSFYSVGADIYNLTKGLLLLRVGMSHPEYIFIVSKIDSVFKIAWISQIHV